MGGEAISLGIKDNTTLLRLDYRMTGITQESGCSINMSLKNNNDKYKRKCQVCWYTCLIVQVYYWIIWGYHSTDNEDEAFWNVLPCQ